MTEIGWRSDIPAADQQRICDIVEAATRADGVAPVGEQVLRELTQDHTSHLLAVDAGSVVGYLNLAPATDSAPPMAELVVNPDHRGRGIGTTMAKTGLAAGGGATRIWAHGNRDPARRVAAVLGLRPVRELWQMRRPLAELPPATVPAGVSVRSYLGPDDDAELVRVNNAAFAWHPEQGGWTTDDIAQRRSEPWFDAAGLLLAFDPHSKRLLGFHWTKLHTEQPGLGEVYVLGVDPVAHGRGLGTVLTLLGLHYLASRLADHPDPTVMLYTEADNDAAVRTYQQLGFAVVGVDTAYA